LSRPGSSIDRPVIWLAGFEEVRLGAGESAVVSVPVKGREFAHWDGEWKYETGTFDLHVGAASDAISHSTKVNLA
jgi:beta-glucosidase